MTALEARRLDCIPLEMIRMISSFDCSADCDSTACGGVRSFSFSVLYRFLLPGSKGEHDLAKVSASTCPLHNPTDSHLINVSIQKKSDVVLCWVVPVKYSDWKNSFLAAYNRGLLKSGILSRALELWATNLWTPYIAYLQYFFAIRNDSTNYTEFVPEWASRLTP